jgi:hypothetical protein
MVPSPKNLQRLQLFSLCHSVAEQVRSKLHHDTFESVGGAAKA